MTDNNITTELPTRLIVGFMAGLLATATFHQMALWVLWRAGLAPFAPYVFTAVPPLGIPAVVSLAFWGGVWGVVYAAIQPRFPSRGFWAAAFGFGAIFPTLVALLIVLPLKGKPMGGGWHLPLLATAFLINGIWGVGTAGIFKLVINQRRTDDMETDTCIAGELCLR